MGTKVYCVVSGILFDLVAIAHLIRLVYAWPVHIGPVTVPIFVSWFGMIVPAVLAGWAFVIAGRSGGSPAL